MEYAIVLSDDLLKEYYKFKHNDSPDSVTIQNLFNYYKSLHITNVAQLNRIGIDDNVLFSQLLQSNLTQQTLLGLCDKTTFKVILDKSNSDYPHINISKDKLENNYSSTFYKDESRVKAQEHIKALMKDASSIFIYDIYFEKRNNWEYTKKFFKEIVPRKKLDIYYRGFDLVNKGSEVKKIYKDWKLIKDSSNKKYQDLHDRYLLIDNKIEIILTSGFNNLFDESKDFTYIVREK